MTKGDQAVESAADRLERFVRSARASGGVKAKVGDAMSDDAEFLRKLKPSLIKARAKGEAPTDGRPAQGVVSPAGPQLGPRPKPGGKGPNPFVVIGIALFAGFLLARIVDWRGHAHPR
jgi:hypothetical protein